jgi:integrase
MVHALRHIYASRLPEDGASATEIQALVGHESLNTSQGSIDATANQTRQSARAYRTLPGGPAGHHTAEDHHPILAITQPPRPTRTSLPWVPGQEPV